MPDPLRVAGIALGSNIEPRAAHIASAVEALRALHEGPPETFRAAPLYETEPVDCAPGTAAFLNTAAELETSRDAESLLESLHRIEAEAGRPASHGKNAPRTLDLDILYLGDIVLQTDQIAIPHPRLASRPFVLAPLATIAPERKPPGYATTIGALAAACPRDGLRRWQAGNLRDQLAARKRAGRRLAALTAYNHPIARLLDGCGLDFLLVGDSLGMAELGRADTVDVTIQEMLHHTRAVAAAVLETPLVADLPWQVSGDPRVAQAAAESLRAAGAQAVKIEGGRDVVARIDAIRAADIAWVGHLGMLPQRVREEGGYRIKGRNPEEARRLLEDAAALDALDPAAIVLELVEQSVAREITAAVRAPTIGIGSGTSCSGEILVSYDLLGLSPWFRPRFVTPLANLATEVVRAGTAFAAQVRGE